MVSWIWNEKDPARSCDLQQPCRSGEQVNAQTPRPLSHLLLAPFSTSQALQKLQGKACSLLTPKQSGEE